MTGPVRTTSFVSPDPTAPATDVVANVALVLALAGRSVLVVDWEPELPGPEQLLHRVPARRFDAGELHTPRSPVPPDAGPPDAAWPVGRWWQHELVGVPGRLVVAELTDRTGRAGADAGRTTTAQVRRLCQALGDGPFDHVLLNGPALPVDGPVHGGALPADRIAVVLPGTRRGAVEARRVIADVSRTAAGDVRLLPVVRGTGSEEAFDLLRGADRSPAADRDRDGEVLTLPGEGRDPGLLDVLRVGRDAARAAYRRLAEAVDGPGGEPVPPVPAGLVERHAWAAERGRSAVAPPVYALAYAPRDRLEADRIAAWLRDAGAGTTRARPGATGPVVSLASRWTPPDAEADVVVHLGGGRAADGERRGDGAGSGRGPVVDLSGERPQNRRAVLLGRLGLFLGAVEDPVPPEAAGSPVPDMPLADPRFVGRDDVLEDVRDAFAPLDGPAARPGTPPVVLTGPPGMGKTSIAVEYVRRFRPAYPAVCWLPAADTRRVRAGLARLAEREGWRSARGGAHAALEGLRADGAQGRRWLVVVDGATGDALVDLPLEGLADVLVTATSGYRPPSAREARVDELPRSDGALVVQGVEPQRGRPVDGPGLTDAEAALAAAAVGGSPLPLALASSWLRERVDELPPGLSAEIGRREALDQLATAVDRAASAGRDPLTAVLRLVRAELTPNRVGQLVVALAAMCSFLAPDGVALAVLRSRPFQHALARLAGDAGALLLADEREIERVIALGARFGVFVVDWEAPASLRMHRVLQRGVQELAGPAVAGRSRAAVLAALAELAPPARWPAAGGVDAEEVGRHFGPSGAADVADAGLEEHLGAAGVPGTAGWQVRRWVVEHVARAAAGGSPEDRRAALALAERTAERWTTLYRQEDPLRCRLVDQHAHLLFRLDRVAEARAVDEDLLAVLRRTLGNDHPRSLHTAGALAGDLHHLGKFEEAHLEQLGVWQSFVATFGPDHPDAVAEGNNLAAYQFLSGRHSEALALQRECHRRSARVLGPGHPWFRSSLRKLGTYLSASGWYTEARTHLQQAQDKLPVDGGDGEEQLIALALAAVDRRSGAHRDPDTGLNGANALLRAQRERLDADHPHLLAAVLNRALELHRVGRGREAAEAAEECAEGLRRRFGPRHPYVAVVDVDLVAFQRSAGRLDDALRTGQRTRTELRAAVGDLHPWYLAATVNHAVTVLHAAAGGAGEADGARALTGSVLAACREAGLGRPHPVRVTAEHNLAVTGRDAAAAARWRDVEVDLPVS